MTFLEVFVRRVAAWLAHDRRRPRPRPPHVTRENESPTYNTCIPPVYKSNRAGAGLYRVVRAFFAGIKRRSCPSSRIVFDRSQPSLCFSPSRSAQGGAPEQKRLKTPAFGSLTCGLATCWAHMSWTQRQVP